MIRLAFALLPVATAGAVEFC